MSTCEVGRDVGKKWIDSAEGRPCVVEQANQNQNQNQSLAVALRSCIGRSMFMA